MFDDYHMQYMSHDLFRWRGLSKNGLRLFEFMLLNPDLTIVEISQKTGMHQKTIRRKIEKMKYAELVVSDSNIRGARFRIVDKHDIDRAARILGTMGDGERQIKQFHRERLAYRSYVFRMKN